MNTWLFFSILPPFLWALTNVIDQVLRKRYVKNDLALAWLMISTRLPIAIVLFIVIGFKFPPTIPLVIMIFGGILWTIPMFFYLKALEKEEVSRVGLFMQSVPIFALILGIIFLKETLNINQVVAFGLILLGGIFASIKNMGKKWRISSALILIIIASFFWATSDLLFKKFEPAFPSFLSAFTYFTFGSCLTALLIIGIPKIKIIGHLKSLTPKSWLLLGITQIASIGGSLAFAYALTLGKMSLTAVLVGIQPLFGLTLGLIFARLSPEFFKEDTTKKALLLKATAFTMVIVGFIFIQS